MPRGNSMRQMKCKHIFGIEYAIRLATVKDVDKLPDPGKERSYKVVYRGRLFLLTSTTNI